jgi:signal transduction histidine kinase
MPRKDTAIQRTTQNAGLNIDLQDIVDSIEDEFIVIDSDYRVRMVNLKVQGRVQQRTKSLIGGLCYHVLHDRNRPCSAPLWECPLRKVLESGTMTTVIHPDHVPGTNRYLKITTYPLRDSRGNATAIVELRRDVSAERDLESQILRRHHQLLALSHITSAVSGLWDLDAILKIALDNVLEITNSDIGGILLLDEGTQDLRYRVQRGLSAKYAEEVRMRKGEGIGGSVAQSGEPMLSENISQDPRAAHPDLISAEGLKGFISIPLKAKDQVVGVMNLASHVAGRFGTDDVSLLSSVGDYLGTAIEHARLHTRLESAGKRYQTLLRYSLSAQEEERKRIARELHDETSQSITSLTLNLQAIIQMAEMKGIKDTEIIEKLKMTHSYAIHAGHEVVKLMKELRPTLLDELGLPAAIHRYAKDTLQVQGIEVSAEFIGAEERLPPEVEVTLFRVAQGVIGNILEHSMAKNTSIKLVCNVSECQLCIEDDGQGFNVDKVTRVDPSGRGAGVFTMKERVKLVGGVCHIDSRPGQGTRVVVSVPLGKDVAIEEDKGANSR